MSEQVKEFWKSGISIHSIARIIHWSNLEGTSRFLVQTPAQSRANFNVRSGCSRPPVKLWKSANMEIRCLSGLLLLVFNNSRGRIFSFCPASVFHRNRWWLPLIHSLCTSERSLAPFFPLTLLDGHRQQKNHSFLQAEQTQLLQHLLLCCVLLKPHHPGRSPLDSLPYVSFPIQEQVCTFLVEGPPKLRVLLQMQPHKCTVTCLDLLAMILQI